MPSSLGSLCLHLDEFDGPLSLLLHLIDRRELEVTRVSVAAVADQFLSLVAAAGSTDLAITGEFVAAAARLLLIKSRALIYWSDQHEIDEVGDDAEVLARQITEYARFQDLARSLGAALESDRQTYPRPIVVASASSAQSLPRLRADSLRRAVLRLTVSEPCVHEETDDWPEVRYSNVRGTLIADVGRLGNVTFEALCARAWHPLVVVTMFLAVLDTVRSGQIIMDQPVPFGSILLMTPRDRAGYAW